jgi:tetratricopeptide (TPR) repeat protein
VDTARGLDSYDAASALGIPLAGGRKSKKPAPKASLGYLNEDYSDALPFDGDSDWIEDEEEDVNALFGASSIGRAASTSSAKGSARAGSGSGIRMPEPRTPRQRAADAKKQRRRAMPLFVFYGFIVLMIVTFLIGFSRDARVYKKGIELFQNGDYGAAVTQLEAVEAYKDSKVHLLYAKAKIAEAAGDYATAAEGYRAVTGFLDSVERTEHCDKESIYKNADADLAKGERSAAFRAFTTLGEFKDAPARALECLETAPQTGVLYHNPDYDSNDSSLVVNILPESDKDVVIKVYTFTDDPQVVALAFVRRSESVKVSVPVGSYFIKAGFGDSAFWFGEDKLFGDDAFYIPLQNHDGSTELATEMDVDKEVAISAKFSDEGGGMGQGIPLSEF